MEGKRESTRCNQLTGRNLRSLGSLGDRARPQEPPEPPAVWTEQSGARWGAFGETAGGENASHV